VRLANRIKQADAALMDEVRAMMERLRDFAIDLYERSPSERQAYPANSSRAVAFSAGGAGSGHEQQQPAHAAR
jgi:hypothetical protein